MNLSLWIKKNGLLSLGLIMLFLLLLTTFFGQYLPSVDSELTMRDYIWNENRVPVAPPYSPSEDFPIGSDRLGRDLWSLIVFGAKETLFIVLAITLIRYIAAIPLAYFAHKGVFGASILLNWLNGFLSYIPTVIIVVLFANLPPILLSPFRPFYLILIIAFLEVGRVADMLRLEFNQLSTKEFITSGISIGASSFRLLKSYFMPHLFGKLAVSIVTDLGKVMFLFGQLGFIQIFIAQVYVQTDPGIFEIQNQSLSWTALLSNSYSDLRRAIWIPFYPALAITYVIFTFNILAEGLQRRFKLPEL